MESVIYGIEPIFSMSVIYLVLLLMFLYFSQKALLDTEYLSFFIVTVLHIHWSRRLESNRCNWKKTGSNEPSWFMLCVCLCIVFVCAVAYVKRASSSHSQKNICSKLFTLSAVYKSVAAVRKVTIKVTPWGSLFIFSFSLSWRPSRAHFLSSATSAVISNCQQEN